MQALFLRASRGDLGRYSFTLDSSPGTAATVFLTVSVTSLVTEDWWGVSQCCLSGARGEVLAEMRGRCINLGSVMRLFVTYEFVCEEACVAGGNDTGEVLDRSNSLGLGDGRLDVRWDEAADEVLVYFSRENSRKEKLHAWRRT